MTIEVHLDERDLIADMRREVREGLSRPQKQLPPKFFYDEHGSELFEKITELPEYYQTRTERAILEQIAPGFVESEGFRELLEFGSGSSQKTHVLLSAMQRTGHLDLYLPIDVSETMLRSTASVLPEKYEGLRVHGIVADFTRHIDRIPEGDHRLLIFLGGTIGNFAPAHAHQFLDDVRQMLGPSDRFLLGADLVKDVSRVEAAYDDSEGVTAEFNRNVLRVLNNQLGADFQPEEFEHVSFFNEELSRIEMRLRTSRAQTVHIPELEMTVDFEESEEILTEISCKYTRPKVESMFAEAGLELCDWFTDPEDLFALASARLRR